MIVPASEASQATINGRVFAALSYFTFVPAVAFLFVRRFKGDRLVRFHALQSIFFFVALLAEVLVLRMVFWLGAFIPRFGYLLGSLAVLLAGLASVILWLLLVGKALRGERFKVPIIGHFAEK